jgi:translation initiation factor 2 alpha subunit (eIF-2alpha)
MAIEEGDIVLCTVDRIAGTIVFVKIDSENKEGSIILSEIAPGRIRNLRDYVVPKKKIVCKVLRIVGDQIHLSLRRVTQKEQKEVREKYKQEKSYKSILKTILKEKTEETIKKIQEKEGLYEFLENAKEDSKELEKIVGKENSKKVLEILKTQKQKKAIIKKEIGLTTTEPEGIEKIKELLKKIKAEINYISAGKYLIKIEGKDMKNTDTEMKKILEEIEDQSKKQGIEMTTK